MGRQHRLPTFGDLIILNREQLLLSWIISVKIHPCNFPHASSLNHEGLLVPSGYSDHYQLCTVSFHHKCFLSFGFGVPLK